MNSLFNPLKNLKGAKLPENPLFKLYCGANCGGSDTAITRKKNDTKIGRGGQCPYLNF